MNWSTYSRYVGDVFGAPLAMEGLAAFFLESTFLGLWIFGWGRLGRRLHLATIYIVAIGTNLSAFFILAANSWMQHPVGYKIDPATGHAHLTSILEVLTNSTVLYAFPHTIGAAVMTAGHAGRRRLRLAPAPRLGRPTMFGRAIRIALPVVLVATFFTTIIGHGQAQLMTTQQPMKMAAAEALYTTRRRRPLSLFAVAPFEAAPDALDVRHPHPQPALDPRHELARRQGRGRSTPSRSATRPSTARATTVLSSASPTGRSASWPGSASSLLAAHGLRDVAALAGHARAVAPVPAPDDVGDRPAHPRQHGRLDLHRDGPPAVGRPGPPADPQRRLPERAGLGGRNDADRLHPALRRCSPRSTGGSCSGTRRRCPPADAGGRARWRPATSRWRTRKRRTMPTGYWHLQTLWFGADRRSSGSATSSSRGSTSASARCCRSSAATTPTGASSSTPSAPSGTATRCGCSSPAAPPSPRSPGWYATLFSGFYLALFVILVALIVRGVAFEYRGKHDSPRWRAWWDRAIFFGSAAARAAVGRRASPTSCTASRSTGPASSPATSSRCSTPTRSSPGSRRSPLFTLHGAVFLTIRTKGELVERARDAARKLSLAAAVLVFAFLAWTYANAVSAHDKGIVPGVIPLSAVGLVIAVPFIVRAGRDGLAFTATTLTIGLMTATIFLNLYPRVMVSSTSTAFDLTVWNSSSSHYTLAVMTVVALSLTPVVLLYQGWTYYVFRHRSAATTWARSRARSTCLSGKPGGLGGRALGRLTHAAGRSAPDAGRPGRAPVPGRVRRPRPLATAAMVIVAGDAHRRHRRPRVPRPSRSGGARGAARRPAAAALARGLLAWAFEAGGHLTPRRPRRGELRRALVAGVLGDRRRRGPPARHVDDRGGRRRRRTRPVLRPLPAPARPGGGRAGRRSSSGWPSSTSSPR